MQTIQSYYYDNEIDIQFDIDGDCLILDQIKQRNRFVYTRTLQLYKGVTNILKVTVLNSDQKPLNITGHQLTFNIVDDYVFANANVVLSTNVTVTNATIGTGYVALPALDLVQLDREQYNYNIKINTCWGNVASYIDDNYGAAGQIFVSNSAYPVSPPIALDLGQISDPVTSAMFDFGNI
jgi:hypothetical protein